MNQEQATIPLNVHLGKMYEEVLAETGAVAVFFSSYESTEHVMKTLAEALVKFKVCLGRYDGQYETSYCLAAPHLPWLVQSGLVDGQESMMLLNEAGHGFLMYNKLDMEGNIRVEPMGEVVQISYEEAHSRPAFTFHPEDGVYYGTELKKDS